MLWLGCRLDLHRYQGFAQTRKYSNEAALPLRSRRSGTKFAAPLFAELLIKYQRLPRGFFWNTFLSELVYWLFGEERLEIKIT